MSYRYAKSEEFRAHVFLFLGYALMSPGGISVLEYIIHDNKISVVKILFAFVIFVFGFLTITHAYSIINEKDERDV